MDTIIPDTREPMTLRKLIAKLEASDTDSSVSFLDLPIGFIVRDGHRNVAFCGEMPADAWPNRHYPTVEGEVGYLRFEATVSRDGYRLVKERK